MISVVKYEHGSDEFSEDRGRAFFIVVRVKPQCPFTTPLSLSTPNTLHSAFRLEL